MLNTRILISGRMKETNITHSRFPLYTKIFFKETNYFHSFIVMGNCFQCTQKQKERSAAIDRINSASNKSTCHRQFDKTNIPSTQKYLKHTVNLNMNDNYYHNDNNDVTYRDKTFETGGLLYHRSPLKPDNYSDREDGSFKKAIMPVNCINTAINDIIITGNELSEMSDNILNKLFEVYKEPDEDTILTDGIERLCRDLNYEPDEFPILVLAWCLDASQMCRFTRAEFIEGLRKMRAHSIDTIRFRLEQTIETLKIDAELFKQLYRFTFRFGLEPDQRILPLDMAICLWKLVFTVHTPILLNKWINFLDQHPNIRGIPKDTWFMFLNFSEQCDIHNYDDTEAWPSLFDDFVDYERAVQTVDTIALTCDDDNNNDDNTQQQYHKTSNERFNDYNNSTL